jgi:hypothetical protein
MNRKKKQQNKRKADAISYIIYNNNNNSNKIAINSLLSLSLSNSLLNKKKIYKFKKK